MRAPQLTLFSLGTQQRSAGKAKPVRKRVAAGAENFDAVSRDGVAAPVHWGGSARAWDDFFCCPHRPDSGARPS